MARRRLMIEPEQLNGLERGFRVGRWRVRPLAGEVRGGTALSALRLRGRRARHVEPKAIRVLLALASRPGEFVSKEILIRHAWDGRPVTDDVLTRAIHSLRAALDDNPRDPTYIETRNSVGYRLLKPVEPMSTGWRRRSVLGLVAAALALLAVVAIQRPLDRNSAPGSASPKTIAVLPFLDLSEAEGSEYLAAGMTESLISTLARQPEIRVISRTSVMPFARHEGSAADIAAQLGADLLVEGSVQQVNGEIRIAAQLIEPYQDVHLWASHYDRPTTDVLRVQQEISETVAVQIGALVEPSAPARVSPIPAAAMHDFLRARYELAREDVAAAESARATFSSIARQHPEFAEAYLGEAQALLFLFKQRAHEQSVLKQAMSAALKFESLAGPSPESHRCIGQIELLSRWDFGSAERRYQAAIELNPSDTVARRRYAWLLVALRRYDAATAQIQQVRLLDPSYYDNAEMATLLLLSGRVAQAVREFERLDRIKPLDKGALRTLATAYLASGREREAHAAFVRMLVSGGLLSPDGIPALESMRSEALYRRILELGPFRSEVAAAGFQNLAGDRSAALGSLEQAVSKRDPSVIFVGALPELASLHGTRRFQQMLGEIGIVPENVEHLRDTQLLSENLMNPQRMMREK